MKLSPLQLDPPEYPIVVAKATPNVDEALHKTPLPIKVSGRVLYDSSGEHFAYISVEQKDETHPYVLQIDAYAPFKIDIEGCRQAYKAAFNPEVVAVNVARVLFSGARELLAVVTSRGPWGTANLPTVLIDPSDVEIGFEEGKIEEILTSNFGLSPEVIERAKARADAQLAGEAVADVAARLSPPKKQAAKRIKKPS
jgi:hypothetical protein